MVNYIGWGNAILVISKTHPTAINTVTQFYLSVFKHDFGIESPL